MRNPFAKDNPYLNSNAISAVVAAVLIVCFVVAAWNWEKRHQLRIPPASASESERQDYWEAKWGCRIKVWVAVVVAVVVFIVWGAIVTNLWLREGLAALEPLASKTRDEVVRVLGPPIESEYSENGKVERARWGRPPMFRFALEFRDGICVGLIHIAETNF